MKSLRVILGEELWLVSTPDGLVLCTPTVRRREGGGAPGLVTPAPRVLREGQVVTLLMPKPPGPCQGCVEKLHALDRLERAGTWPWPDDHVFEHNHGPQETHDE